MLLNVDKQRCKAVNEVKEVKEVKEVMLSMGRTCSPITCIMLADFGVSKTVYIEVRNRTSK